MSFVGWYGTNKTSMAYVILADDEFQNPPVIDKYSDVLLQTATHTKIFTNCGIGIHARDLKDFARKRNIEIIKLYKGE